LGRAKGGTTIVLTKATVLGSGAMGTVMAQILAANCACVALLVRRPEVVEELLVRRENRRYLPGMRLSEKIVPTADAARALANCELAISAMPCQFVREAWQRCGPLAPPDALVCSVTKGIEMQTLLRPSEIIREIAAEQPLAVLSGPSIAPEMARCLPTTVVLACSDTHLAEQLQTVLSTSWFRVYTGRDVRGVELAGALKNVIALAAGILDGLHAGDNAKAALLTRGLVEITRLGVALGARPQTFAGLAGIGDLITTCVSPLGRNRRAGERIGLGARLEDVVRESPAVIEGIPTTRAVLALAERHGVEMPITQAVYDVLFLGKPPEIAISELMSRPPKREEIA
jgi:glycerol-3-phosphate dehydrogenase (NAD(P)+)